MLQFPFPPSLGPLSGTFRQKQSLNWFLKKNVYLWPLQGVWPALEIAPRSILSVIKAPKSAAGWLSQIYSALQIFTTTLAGFASRRSLLDARPGETLRGGPDAYLFRGFFFHFILFSKKRSRPAVPLGETRPLLCFAPPVGPGRAYGCRSGGVSQPTQLPPIQVGIAVPMSVAAGNKSRPRGRPDGGADGADSPPPCSQAWFSTRGVPGATRGHCEGLLVCGRSAALRQVRTRCLPLVALPVPRPAARLRREEPRTRSGAAARSYTRGSSGGDWWGCGSAQAGHGAGRAQCRQGTVQAGHGAGRARSISAHPDTDVRAGVGLKPGAFPFAGKSMVSEQTDKVQAAKVGRGRFRLTTEEKRDSSH